jgi:hypothetical protein
MKINPPDRPGAMKKRGKLHMCGMWEAPIGDNSSKVAINSHK